MKTLTVEIPDAVELAVREFARQTARQPTDVVRDALETYLAGRLMAKPQHRAMDIKPVAKGGTILKLGTTREELLSDFFDDRN